MSLIHLNCSIMTVAKYSSADFYKKFRTAYGDCEEIKSTCMLFAVDVDRSLTFSGEYYVYVVTSAYILIVLS